MVRKGQPPLYGQEEAEVFWKTAKAAEYPCGKRLAQMKELWLPHYEVRYGKLETGLRQQGAQNQRGADRPLTLPSQRLLWRARAKRNKAGRVTPDTYSHSYRQLGHQGAGVPGGRHGGPLWRLPCRKFYSLGFNTSKLASAFSVRWK